MHEDHNTYEDPGAGKTPAPPSQVPSFHAEPPPPPSAGMMRGFGQDEMPDEAKRFAWGAFLLTPFWGVAYGLPSVIGWWSLSYFASLVVAQMVVDVTDASMLALASAVMLVIGSCVKLWIGMNATTWLWKREGRRMEVLKGVPPRFTVAGFIAKQRKWVVIGFSLLGLSLLSFVMLATLNTPEFVQVRTAYGMTQVEIAVSGAWTVAETLLAFWLANKLRDGVAEVPAAPGGVSS